jgi:hypothetical protein
MKHKETLGKIRESLYCVKKSRKKNGHLNQNRALLLQEYALTPGFHCILTASKRGPEVLQHIFKKITPSMNIGFLSLNTRAPSHCVNVYEELNLSGALNTFNGSLEEYLLCSFSCQMLIINATPELLKEPWFGKFEQLLIEYNFHQDMSVITIFYE